MFAAAPLSSSTSKKQYLLRKVLSTSLSNPNHFTFQQSPLHNGGGSKAAQHKPASAQGVSSGQNKQLFGQVGISPATPTVPDIYFHSVFATD